jgi:transposase-like protein
LTPWSGRLPNMKNSDVTCPKCRAGYRRIELVSRGGSKSEFRCLTCNHLLEVFDGSTEVAFRLTVQPTKPRNKGHSPFSN